MQPQERHSLSGLPPLAGIRLEIRTATDADRFSFRLDPALSARAERALGMPLALRIGTTAASDGRVSVRLGPDEWYLLAPSGTVDRSDRRLREAVGDGSWSLVDVSHREVGIEVSGEAAALALRSFVAFDVEGMPVGDGCRTLFDRVQVILIREAADRFRIEAWQSFAPHVWKLLEAVSREIALEI